MTTPKTVFALNSHNRPFEIVCHFKAEDLVDVKLFDTYEDLEAEFKKVNKTRYTLDEALLSIDDRSDRLGYNLAVFGHGGIAMDILEPFSQFVSNDTIHDEPSDYSPA